MDIIYFKVLKMRLSKIILIFLAIFALSCNKKTEEEAKIESAKTSMLEKDKYLDLGNKITAETFQSLSTELMNAVNQGGLESAVEYCNVQALPITAKFETTYNVKIKRVGTRIRNEQNKPDEIEAEVIKMFQLNIDSNKDTKPVVMKLGDIYHYFNYIRTKPMCLNCHGTKGETLQDSVYKKILEKYPNDQAIAYKKNDLRGIWHITFNK